MPTLSSLLDPEKNQLVRQGTTLTREKKPSTPALVSGAGLSSSPITPAGVGMLGGTPDQTKMAGTPAQKQNAMKRALEGESLANTLRTSQARTEATAAEQRQKQTQEQLAGLGTLQNKVQSFIDAATSGIASQAGVATGQKLLGGQVSSSVGITDDPNTPVNEAAEFERLAKQYADSNFSDTAALAAMGNIATKRNPSVNVDTLGEKLKGIIAPETTIAGTAAQNIANQVTVADLVSRGELGYTTDELASILGMNPAEVSGLTIEGLQARVANEVALADQYEATRQAVESGELGGAEASAARGFMRDLSATGLTASEAEMQRLGQQVAAGDQVTVGGKEYQVSDLLKDATIQQIITDYLANPGSEESKQLAAENPELTKWITDNKNALAEASSKLEAGAGTIKQATASRQDFLSRTGLSREQLEEIMPGISDLTASWDPSSAPPLLQMAAQNPTIRNEIQQITDPAAVRDLASMSAEEIQALGIGTAGSPWDLYKKQQQAVAEATARLNFDHSSTDAALDALFEGAPSTQEIENVAADRQAGAQLGLDIGGPSVVDNLVNPDGTVRSAQDIASILDSQRPSALSVRDILAGARPDLTVPKSESLPPKPMPTSDVEASLLNKLRGVVSGGIDGYEMRDLDLNIDEAIRLRNSPLTAANPGARDILRRRVAEMTRDYTLNSLKDITKQDIPRSFNLPAPDPQVYVDDPAKAWDAQMQYLREADRYNQQVQAYNDNIASYKKSVQSWMDSVRDRPEGQRIDQDIIKKVMALPDSIPTVSYDVTIRDLAGNSVAPGTRYD